MLSLIANAAAEPSESGAQQGSRVYQEGSKKGCRVQQQFQQGAHGRKKGLLWPSDTCECNIDLAGRSSAEIGSQAEFWTTLYLSFPFFLFRLFKFPRADSRCWPLNWPRRCPTQLRSYLDSSKNTTRGPLDTLQYGGSVLPWVFTLPNANLSAAYYRYSPNELRYLPVSTALYEPPLDPELPALDSEPDSDDADDGNEDKKNKNSSVRRETQRNALIDAFSLLPWLTPAWLPSSG